MRPPALGWFLSLIATVWLLEHLLLGVGLVLMWHHYVTVVGELQTQRTALDHLLHGGKLIQDGEGKVLWVAPDTIRHPRP